MHYQQNDWSNESKKTEKADEEIRTLDLSWRDALPLSYIRRVPCKSVSDDPEIMQHRGPLGQAGGGPRSRVEHLVKRR